MFIIGELINGMYQDIARAIKEKQKKIIQDYALLQIRAGADALDVNCGPASKDPILDIQWLIESIQDIAQIPLCIDSSKPKVIESGLKVLRNPAIINSTTADIEKLEALVPLAKKFNAKLIGLAISSQGIPQNKDQRLELAAAIVSFCAEEGYPLENLYLDPIVLPVNVAQAQMGEILQAIHDFKIIAEPSPKTIIGLSNISQGAQVRDLINSTFLTMALAFGLDAAILNPQDERLMDTLITAELILNRHIYCDSFLSAYRKK
jgi:5-methyltetrahydrofolate corrinoid/iron sulfur protein methyltransferase